jgi:UDP-glucose 4-epimerase
MPVVLSFRVIKMASYLVTGGAGFIGSHLVERLVCEGHSVRVLDNLSTGCWQNLAHIPPSFQRTEGDAADPVVVRSLIKGVDGVFHLAAVASVASSVLDPLQTQRSGEVALLNVLDQARRAGVRRVVFSSSAAVYGETTECQNHEQLVAAPLSLYGASKLAGETYARVFSQLYPDLDTVNLRYFNVFGLRQDPSSPYSGVISIFLRCAQQRRAPTIFGDGRQTRDFVPVENIICANLLAMQHPMPLRGECFNVGTGISASLLDVWLHLESLAGIRLTPLFAPARAGDIRHSCANITKITRVLGYRTSLSWQEGLNQLWEAASNSR